MELPKVVISFKTNTALKKLIERSAYRNFRTVPEELQYLLVQALGREDYEAFCINEETLMKAKEAQAKGEPPFS